LIWYTNSRSKLFRSSKIATLMMLKEMWSWIIN